MVTEIIKFSFQAWISARNPSILVVSGISNGIIFSPDLVITAYEKPLSHICRY